MKTIVFAVAVLLVAAHAEFDDDRFEANWRFYKVDMTVGSLVTDFLIETSFTEYFGRRRLQIPTRRRNVPHATI